MKIYRVVVGPIQENCYIIKNEENNLGIIVDPGDEANLILDAVHRAGIQQVVAIVHHPRPRGSYLRPGRGEESHRGQGVHEQRGCPHAAGLEQQSLLFHQPGQENSIPLMHTSPTGRN
jgi:hypothetical protein